MRGNTGIHWLYLIWKFRAMKKLEGSEGTFFKSNSLQKIDGNAESLHLPASKYKNYSRTKSLLDQISIVIATTTTTSLNFIQRCLNFLKLNRVPT